MVVDAGDVGAGIDGRVFPSHDPFQAPFVRDDDSLEAGPVAEAFEAAGRFGGGRPGQLGVFVGIDHGEVVLTAGKSLFALDFRAKSGIAGTGMQGSGDRAARPTSDEPGQGSPEVSSAGISGR
ncbi:hypothetical protein [Streptomyces sp. NRRL S-1022]|uniref:hypothetical protein n=1 Tax=Streptomyces sp. NRRL S-1022 TaxID=1463880 RepID=UPI00131E338D|nr:hypothetical protein [Streptomyces sp. NRRL S-1022]